jgi:triphosphoribosyl-dephospho-CoA synthase
MPDEIAAAFIAACEDELSALKPGNVHRFADGHGMTVRDFELSARAAASPLSEPGSSVGRRILAAIEATQAVCACNTNLGIVLLCAPIAQAAESMLARTETLTPAALAAETRRVLARLDIDDARLAYRAIALAKPAGLGKADQQDVGEAPKVSLQEAMTLAADRDRIAAQYAYGYPDIFNLGLTLFTRPSWQHDRAAAVTGLYLGLLASGLDSHLVRKFGDTVAQSVTQAAKSFQDQYFAMGSTDAMRPALLDWDKHLKASGWNPGTSADLTVATLFVDRLCAMRTLHA